MVPLIAAVMASTRLFVLAVPTKYTARLAPGAADPATSMSSSTSAGSRLPVSFVRPVPGVGLFEPPATGTSTIEGVFIPSCAKYVLMSWMKYPPPNSMIPMHCPVPSRPAG